MGKKIVVVNGSPRQGWNTDTLVREAARGAVAKGAETEIVQLYDLRFSGCVSCFGCKLETHIGRCVHKDDLQSLLAKIREADGLIIGSPIYISDVTAQVRALEERLIFQYVSYKTTPQSYNERRIPVGLIITSGAPEAAYADGGYYAQLVKGQEMLFEMQIGPVKSICSTDTLQVNNYEKYDWTMFDAGKKRERREKVFPTDKQKAFELGAWVAE